MIRMGPSAGRRSAFTLVELLAVIAIIATLVGLLLPAVQSSRESARSTSCRNNVRQLSLGVLSFVDSMGAFPPSYVDNVLGCDGSSAPADNVSGLAWSALILPFVEQKTLWDALGTATNNFTVNWQAAGSQATALAQQPLAMFECGSNRDVGTPNPKRGGFARLTYGPNSGTYATLMRVKDLATPACGGSDAPGWAEAEWKKNVGVFTASEKAAALSPAAIRDGLSSTIMIAERTSTPETGGGTSCGGEPCDPSGGIWIGPQLMPGTRGWSSGLINHDVETYGGNDTWGIYMINRSSAYWGDDWISGSPHAGGGINASMCDGSVRWISENIDMPTYGRLRSRNEGVFAGDSN